MRQDNQLQQAVITELSWEPSVTPSHIGVTAEGGVVTLTGHVDTCAQKLAAETAARRVKGVRAVAEEIEVHLPFETRRGDPEIAAAIVERLSWDSSVVRDSIKVKVEQGWVTLTGQVDWHYQQEAARQDVQRLHGVVGVSDRTTIRARVNTATLSDDIMHALHRSWLFDPATVNVSAEGGHIRLSGTVQTPHERSVALMTAWAAPGATAVENDLVVA